MPIYNYNRAPNKSQNWPDLFYSVTGECKLCFSTDEVPEGWSARKPKVVFNAAPPALDRDDLIKRLNDSEIAIDPRWGVAHMKRILDGDISTSR